ncbi:MAG: L-glyceraldehyde 3-phosphate reductase [Bacteroidales bacterium]|nr:L-glyceraldehyde 3-phosphate reductase [Bacteroidales bacterium]
MVNPPYYAADSRYDGSMTYERCGRSGIQLPRLSLGLWHNFGDVNTLANSREMLHFAFDNGINCFDLANNYGPSYGSAEETFGIIMKKSFRPYRDEMIITSKAGYDMWPGPYGIGGSRKYLMASLDQSLSRMNLDYVDIFYSHCYDPNTPMEETLQALVDIVRQGKALYVGISQWPYEASQFAYDYLAAHDTPCLIYQGRYNMIDRQKAQEGIVEQAACNGVGFTAFSPLEQGVLTSRYLNGIPEGSRASLGKFLKPEQITPELVDKLHRLNDIAAARGQSLTQMSLAWLLKDNALTSVIIGSSSVDQIRDSLGCLSNITFTPEELQAIDSILC